MKTTDRFQKVISAHLEFVALRDPLFAQTLKKKNKSIEECLNYILETVKEGGYNGFEDDEVFAMAIHYYDEDKLKAKPTFSGTVVINHAPTLSFEEMEKAKKTAIDNVIKDEMERLKNKKVVSTKTTETVTEDKLF